MKHDLGAPTDTFARSGKCLAGQIEFPRLTESFEISRTKLRKRLWPHAAVPVKLRHGAGCIKPGWHGGLPARVRRGSRSVNAVLIVGGRKAQFSSRRNCPNDVLFA